MKSALHIDFHHTCEWGSWNDFYPENLSTEQKRIDLDSLLSIILDCKDTKSKPLTTKFTHKRLYFNYFKERLVHFNGTVVIKIIIIGDSWGDLADKYKLPDYIDSIMYVNGIKTKTQAKGEPGAISRKIYQNIHADNKDIHSTKKLIEDNPQYAILLCGINDSHGQYGQDFYSYHTSLIIQEMLYRNIKPIILELPYYDIDKQYDYYSCTKRNGYRLLSFLSDNTTNTNNIARYRRAVKEHLTKQGICNKIIFISIDSLSKQKYYNDCMHLNYQGYKYLANTITSIILKDIILYR